ncbi:hypothetical protein AURDEDRAFT_171695 [Auricularia subglabra TFB-10046 SS5]|nr:hypothetical protein AURDEDRAFT_171695 [Auricularia subglabra TFB-10046 SS5]
MEVAHAAVYTGIMKLPVELLRYIFLDTLGRVDLSGCDYTGWEWNHKPHAWRSSQPFIIGGVCRIWRRVALDLSELWSCICIYRTSDASISTIDLYLATMLSRSKSAPLDVLIHISPFISSIPNEILDSIFAMLTRVSARWRIFYMNAPLSCVPPERIVTLFSEATPLLEDLQMGCDYRWTPGLQVQPVPSRYWCLPYCPKLRWIRMYHTGPATVFPCNHLGVLPSLVRISLNSACVDPDSLWAVLQLTPALEVLMTNNLDPENFQDPEEFVVPKTRLSLPNLRKLEMTAPPSSLVQTWAPMLDLPRLEDVDLSDILTISEFTAIMPLIFDSLRKLNYTCEFCDDTVLPAIATATKLRYLCLGRLDHEDLVMLLQGFNAAPAFLLPELEVLELFYFLFLWERTDEETWTDEHEQSRLAAQALLDFVKARNSTPERDAAAADGRTPPAKLTRVSFADCSFSDQYGEELQALVFVDWQ